MIKNLLCSCILLLSLATVAQPPSYNVIPLSSTFTAITGGTTISNYLFNGAANADDGYSTIPIGFTFNYNGTNYTSITICANGFATFATIPNNTDTWVNSLAAGTPTTGFTAVPRPILAPLWDDMDNGAGGTTYLVSGTAPGRIFTVQWTNQKWQYGATSGVITYQLRLFETSNIIEFRYRQESGTIVNSGDLGASIGISGTATTSFIALTNSSANPGVNTSADPANIVTKPATGQVYMFDKYCQAGSPDVTYEKISNVVFGTISNASTSQQSYENFTNLNTLVIPGNTYPISVSISNAYSTDQVVVFIDFNNNGVFTDAGETVFTSTVPISSATLNGNITIPVAAPLGYTRMRIRMHDSGGGTPNPTSCGNSDYGQVEDYTLNISNCQPASISTQPANASICNGSNGSVSVTATGTGLNYQWQLSTNGGTSWANVPAAAPYSGTTTNTLGITGATASMNGYMYRVLITGTCSALVTSSASTLTVTTAATVTTNPVNASGCVGSTANFSVVATGTSPTYQWQVSTDGGVTYTNISGATSSTLNLTGLTSSQNNTRYRAQVSVAGCGAVTSSAATLTVNNLPTVTLAAAPVTAVMPGVTTTLTATSSPAAAAGGWVWTLNGNTITNATGNTLNVDVSGIGTYRATVTDINGCKNTTAALQITADPSDRLFIYPNPTTGIFQLRLYAGNLYDVRSVTIYNAAGVKVAEKDFNVNARYDQMQFDLRHVAPGVYSIHLEQRYVKRKVVGQVVIIK